eukprot:2236795-Amphidinium_carterae.1
METQSSLESVTCKFWRNLKAYGEEGPISKSAAHHAACCQGAQLNPGTLRPRLQAMHCSDKRWSRAPRSVKRSMIHAWTKHDWVKV